MADAAMIYERPRELVNATAECDRAGSTKGAGTAARGCVHRGAAVVELAIVLPFLLLLVFGIIEFGHVAYVRHVLINAATQGARAAIVPGSTPESVMTAVDAALRDGRISGYNIRKDYISAPSPALDETVTLSIPYSKVSLLGIFEDFTLTSTCTMFRGPLD